MRLLDPRRFVRFARDNGVNIGGGPSQAAELLWQLGWLWADLVRVSPEADLAALPEAVRTRLVEATRDDAGHILYADVPNSDDLVLPGGFTETILPGALPDGIIPMFHPFRLHVLHWLDHLMALNLTSLSTLATPGSESFGGLAQMLLRFKEERFSSPSFAGEVVEHNDRAALAIMAEPLHYPRIVGRQALALEYEPENLGLSEEDYWGLPAEEREARAHALFQEHVREQQDEVSRIYQAAELERLERERWYLMFVSDNLDPNVRIQTLLRVTFGDGAPPGGTTGAAFLHQIMAELLRRAAEENLSVELPEEDLMRPSMLSPEARADRKERAWGAKRILDDDERRRDFIRAAGLDPGPRIRWYVEGATENGALAEVFGEHGELKVVLINLRAQFPRKNNKIDEPGFLDALLKDIDAGIYSYISLDADDKDTRRAVENAVRREEVFGRLVSPNPDFELGNFELDELGEVLFRKACESGAPENLRQRLLDAVRGVESGTYLFKAAHAALPEYLEHFGKGREWGQRLIAYALENRNRPNGERRQIVDAIEAALAARGSHYANDRARLRVDLKSGLLVPR